MTVNSTEPLLVTTISAENDEMREELFDRPLSVRDRIRLMNLDASASNTPTMAMATAPVSTSSAASASALVSTSTPTSTSASALTPTSTPGRGKVNSNALQPQGQGQGHTQTQVQTQVQPQTQSVVQAKNTLPALPKNRFFPSASMTNYGGMPSSSSSSSSPSSSSSIQPQTYQKYQMSYDDSSFNFVKNTSAANAVESNKRCDIVSDPGVSSSQREHNSAAAAITKWRRRRNEEMGGGGGGDGDMDLDTIHTALSDANERTEWTISDLTRSSKKKKKNPIVNKQFKERIKHDSSNLTVGYKAINTKQAMTLDYSKEDTNNPTENDNLTESIVKDVKEGRNQEPELKCLSYSMNTIKEINNRSQFYEPSEVNKDEASSSNSNSKNCNRMSEESNMNALKEEHSKEDENNPKAGGTSTTTTTTTTTTNENKPEGFLEMVKLKAVKNNRHTFAPRQLHQQADSGTFIIPKLRPVRKAPHTLALIMQKTSSIKNNKKDNELKKSNIVDEDKNDDDDNDHDNDVKEKEQEPNTTLEISKVEHVPDVNIGNDHSSTPGRKSRLPFFEKQQPSSIVEKPKGQIPAIESIDESDGSNKKENSENDTKSSIFERTEQAPITRKKVGTPQRSKVSDRIKAFSSVYSGSNTIKPKPSVPTPPKRMKFKRSLLKIGGNHHEEDASHDSSERVTVQSYDDDSISVLTPMGNTGTPARLGAHPPTPNSYNSEAAYTAVSSGDGAVAGSLSSTQKQQLQMRYAKFDTPDVSQDGGSTASTSYCVEEFQKISAIKISLQSKLEHDKKKAVRKKIAPNHVKVPSVLVAAQKRAQDLKPQWGENVVVEYVDASPSPSKIIFRPALDKDVVKEDLKNIFDCEKSLVSKHKQLYDNKNNDNTQQESRSIQQEEIEDKIDVVEKEDTTSKPIDNPTPTRDFNAKKKPFLISSPKASSLRKVPVQTRVTKPKSPLRKPKINYLMADNDIFPADEQECDARSLQEVLNQSPVDNTETLQSKQVSACFENDNTTKVESEISANQYEDNKFSTESLKIEQKLQPIDNTDFKNVGTQNKEPQKESTTLPSTKTQKLYDNDSADGEDSATKEEPKKASQMESIILRPTKTQKAHTNDIVDTKATEAQSIKSEMESITLLSTKLETSLSNDDSNIVDTKAIREENKESQTESIARQSMRLEKPPCNDDTADVDAKAKEVENKEFEMESTLPLSTQMQKPNGTDDIDQKVIEKQNEESQLKIEMDISQSNDSMDSPGTKIKAEQTKEPQIESVPSQPKEMETLQYSDGAVSVDTKVVRAQNKDSRVESTVVQTKNKQVHNREDILDDLEVKPLKVGNIDSRVESKIVQTKGQQSDVNHCADLKLTIAQNKGSPIESKSPQARDVGSNTQVSLEIPHASSGETQSSLSSQFSRMGDKKSLTKADAVKELIKRRRRRRGNKVIKEEVIPKKENLKTQVTKEESETKNKVTKIFIEKPIVGTQTKAAEGNGYSLKEKFLNAQSKKHSKDKKLTPKKNLAKALNDKTQKLTPKKNLAKALNDKTQKLTPKKNLAKALNDKTQVESQTKISASNGFGMKEKSRNNQFQILSKDKKSTPKDKENKVHSDKTQAKNTEDIGLSLSEKSRSIKQKALSNEFNEFQLYSTSSEISETSNKEKSKATKTPLQLISTLRYETNTKVSEKSQKKTEKEEEDSSGFIPMKTNAAKDRRSRFMKATNMKRKAHNRSLQQQKQNEVNKHTKNKSISTQKQSATLNSRSEVTEDLPVLPPSIIRSISDDRYLEAVIEQKPSNPSIDKLAKGTTLSWSLDSEINDSKVKDVEDEPEPVIESFIHSDLSPIRSVDQSKHVYEASSPYHGSPEVHKINNDYKNSTPPRSHEPYEVERQSTPRRRNRRGTTSKSYEYQHTLPQNSSINGSESGSQISHALSAPITSSLEKKQQTAKRVSDLLRVPLNRSVDEYVKRASSAERTAGSKASSRLKSVDDESEASSSVRSTSSSGQVSSRVNRLLTTRRQKMNRIKQQQQQQSQQYQMESNSNAILAKNLARKMLGEKQPITNPTSDNISSGENKDQQKHPIMNNNDMNREKQYTKLDNKAAINNDPKLKKKSGSSTALDILESEDALKNYGEPLQDQNQSPIFSSDNNDYLESSFSFESEYLDITDGQVSVDASELLNEKEQMEDKENREDTDDTPDYNDCTETTIKTKTTANGIIRRSPDRNDRRTNEKHDFLIPAHSKNTWFGENIDKLAYDFVNQCDGIDIPSDGLTDGVPYCGSNSNVNVTSDSLRLNISSTSAVRISQEEIPSDEDQEGIEVEYIPTELVDSISDDHGGNINGGSSDNSILMHFNSQAAGSVPMKTNESLFGISNDTSSEFSSGRYYNRKY